ncbi:P-loop containing nucleoside triphosphate hydrolase protein [Jimgerdemannia flammicorona]|uniref:Kinesin-like protein n=1 Tax=Jimgerdemannia flammicorona TaxID=994334 RepID=A0A433Q509_9FUNG|nr:P-loop containing nucleoside triphosphate hydrolase protein [Jimgerdemannia flammicorona]
MAIMLGRQQTALTNCVELMPKQTNILLSMQDYTPLGVTALEDRKRLFQLVQTLRQELPGVTKAAPPPAISQPAPVMRVPQTAHRRPSEALQPNVPRTFGTPGSGDPNPVISSNPAPSTSRRTNNLTAPSTSNTNTDTAKTPPMTRSRSRTLPGQMPRPDILSSSPSKTDDDFAILRTKKSGDLSAEARRGAGPLLDAYGVPVANKGGVGTKSNLASGAMGLSDLNQKIRVCVRKRPLNRKELERNEIDVAPKTGLRSIVINEPKVKVDLTRYTEQHNFTFDEVFDLDVTNEEVYQRTALPLVNYIFGGGKATCFAYGQTGSGKTFTMLDARHGLYVLAARDIFAMLGQPRYSHLSAWIGFYELYQGHLYDLLNDRKRLFAREDGKQNVVISGLKEYPINDVNNLMQVFEYGSSVRSTGSTGANADSSRSHAVLQVLLKPKKNRKQIVGKLSFIDLAGSERGADRGESDQKTRMEGAEINKSLLALKECIRALDQAKTHTPFRQSKLTQVLKDSFVGNSRTCMIATVSPNGSNSEHTLNTLRYADRVKELKGERDRRRHGEDQGVKENNETNDNGYRTRQSSDPNTWRESPSVENRSPSPEEEDYSFSESDDPDLFVNEDEDNFLDEDFPSDHDILNEDFPHEDAFDISDDDDEEDDEPEFIVPSVKPATTPLGRHQHHIPHIAHRPQTHGERFTLPSSRLKPPEIPRPRSSTSTDSTGSTSNSTYATPPMYNTPVKQSSRRIDDLVSPPEELFGTPTPQEKQVPSSRYTPLYMHRSRSATTIVTTGKEHGLATPPVPTFPPALASPSMARTSSSSSNANTTQHPDLQTMDEFIKQHRAEIREVTECSKSETKLLANFTLGMSSQDQNHGSVDRTGSEFEKYLRSLDEVLEIKVESIEHLRGKIKRILEQGRESTGTRLEG